MNDYEIEVIMPGSPEAFENLEGSAPAGESNEIPAAESSPELPEASSSQAVDVPEEGTEILESYAEIPQNDVTLATIHSDLRLIMFLMLLFFVVSCVRVGLRSMNKITK